MDYSKKQKELDVIKWVDSEFKNYDTCGEYCYCCNCNKSEAYPCAYAFEKYNAINKAKTTISTAKTTKTLKTSTKKSACKTTTKKPTTSKTTTKKTTTKKTVKA